MNHLKKNLWVPWWAYSMYGGTRFVQEDIFVREKESKPILKEKERPKMYVDGFGRTLGLFTIGACAYGFPPSAVWTLPNELYRLEVNLRGLHSEKDTYRYNRTLFDSYVSY
jgi:hypothetical protein